jgi:hypothetical protein
MSEHDFEPIRGLPGPLPEGETILWQGAPRWSLLSQQAFHVRLVAAYFALMLAWRAGGAVIGGQAPILAIESALSVTPIALAAVGMLALLGWLNSRTTVYTITNRRIVMRFGAALTKAINIPFTIIEGAALKPLGHGAGDLAIALKAPSKIGFLNLWPHARPWRVTAPQPTLRAVPDALAVATILAGAMEKQMPAELARLGEQPRAPRRGAALGDPETAVA